MYTPSFKCQSCGSWVSSTPTSDGNSFLEACSCGGNQPKPAVDLETQYKADLAKRKARYK